MSTDRNADVDPWQRALGPAGRAERTNSSQRSNRPKPGPGRHHRPDGSDPDAWNRALTGPPIVQAQRAS